MGILLIQSNGNEKLCLCSLKNLRGLLWHTPIIRPISYELFFGKPGMFRKGKYHEEIWNSDKNHRPNDVIIEWFGIGRGTRISGCPTRNDRLSLSLAASLFLCWLERCYFRFPFCHQIERKLICCNVGGMPQKWKRGIIHRSLMAAIKLTNPSTSL